MLVCPGNPSGCHTPRPAPDRACSRDCLVCMATGASGHGTSLTSQTKGATVVLGVWMRDLLGGSDDLEGLGQSARIGRLRAPVGEFGLGGQAPLHDLIG